MRQVAGWTTALPAPTIEGDTATYHDIEPGQDLVVKATTTGFETFVVLKTRPEKAPVITVPLSLDGLSLSRDGSGQIKLADTTSKTQASIPQPVMFSSARDERADEPTQKALVDTAVEPGPGGTTQLVLRPDPGFLSDPATVYPIFIDPATTLTSSLNNFVDSAFPNTNYENDSQLKVGTYNGGGSKNRSFIKFSDGAIKGTQVSSATLRVYETWAYSCTSTPMSVQGSTALNSGSNWNSKPIPDGNNWYYGSFTGGYSGCPGTAGWKDLSISGLVQQWAGGTGGEDTLALIAPNETDNYQWKKFSSRSTANPPTITVNYTVPAPTNLPSAPQNVTASAGNTQGTISWSPPANPGNPAYIHYVVFPYQLVNGTWTYASPYAQVLPAGQTSIVLNGLTNGQTYEAYVYTYSSLGYGGWALSNSFVPAVPPTTPANIVATAAPSGGATVRWSPSTTGGGASMSGYILWAYDTTWRSYLVKDCGTTCTFTTFGPQNATPSTPLITGYPTYFYVWGYNSSGQASPVAGSSNYIVPGPSDPTVGAGDRSRFSYDD